MTSAASLVLAAPARAAGSIELPEPSGMTLLALGVAGVLIGRAVAGKRRD